MLSFIHTPILPAEVRATFQFSEETYAMALQTGALQKSHVDADDPARRLRLHNLSDIVDLVARMAYGWPSHQTEILTEHADDLADDLSYAFEKAEELTFGRAHAQPAWSTHEVSEMFFASLQVQLDTVAAQYSCIGIDCDHLKRILDRLLALLNAMISSPLIAEAKISLNESSAPLPDFVRTTFLGAKHSAMSKPFDKSVTTAWVSTNTVPFDPS